MRCALDIAMSDVRIAAQVRTEKTLSFLFDKARKEAPKETTKEVSTES